MASRYKWVNWRLLHGGVSLNLAPMMSMEQSTAVAVTYGRSIRKVLTSLHHIAGTDNFTIHTMRRWQYDGHGTP